MSAKIIVGQELWFVQRERRGGKPCYVTVTRVGRKWISAGPALRFDIDTLKQDTGGIGWGGQVYLSKEDWLQEVKAAAAWFRFEDFISKARYAGKGKPKLEAILEAGRLLGGSALFEEMKEAVARSVEAHK